MFISQTSQQRPCYQRAAVARAKIEGPGLRDDEILPYSDAARLEQIDADLQRASPVAAIGQELNLIKAHRALASSPRVDG